MTNGPYDQLAVTDLPWSISSNVTVGCLTAGCSGWNYFSAACWFTLKNTYDMLNGTVPLGGVAQTYGGTSIQWWSSTEAIAACDTPAGSACCNYGGSNSCLYDTQIAPYTIGPMQFSGILWYQGEQNAGCGGPPQIAYYNCGLQALINDWRLKFGNPNLPFGAFLLAAWQDADPYFPLLRLIQVNASLTMNNVFTASTLDYGEPAGGPVHSPYKQVPGYRAALALQALVYGGGQHQRNLDEDNVRAEADVSSVPYIGPRYATSSATSAGTTIQVTIGFTAGSLYGLPLVLNTSVACPSTITAVSCESFAIQTSDCVWHANGNGTMSITPSLSTDGTQLVLSLQAPSGSGLTAVATRGLFGNWPVVQLYNGHALPAEPWLANVDGVVNSCPSPWSQEHAMEAEMAVSGGWRDDGRHA